MTVWSEFEAICVRRLHPDLQSQLVKRRRMCGQSAARCVSTQPGIFGRLALPIGAGTGRGKHLYQKADDNLGERS
jgi:hypothetical protein